MAPSATSTPLQSAVGDTPKKNRREKAQLKSSPSQLARPPAGKQVSRSERGREGGREGERGEREGGREEGGKGRREGGRERGGAGEGGRGGRGRRGGRKHSLNPFLAC